jgi:hypothetical protein
MHCKHVFLLPDVDAAIELTMRSRFKSWNAIVSAPVSRFSVLIPAFERVMAFGRPFGAVAILSQLSQSGRVAVWMSEAGTWPSYATRSCVSLRSRGLRAICFNEGRSQCKSSAKHLGKYEKAGRYVGRQRAYFLRENVGQVL